ncbi:MAG: VanW family protein [Deltaproteobacteria bacterium]|nr:VanW family protein [Deltaproteobacteria bacterium]
MSVSRGLRAQLGIIVPFWLRVEIHRAWRAICDMPLRHTLARRKGCPADFPFVLAEARSPLERVPGAVPAPLQRGKEHNVALVARAIDGVIVEPGQVFSYHRLVGRPSRWRGFRLGLELRENRESSGIGGGSCQVSNQLYWLAVQAGMRIVERHRHGFDLFPDHERSVPFGCGATVFFNYRDLRFANPLAGPVCIQQRIEAGALFGRILAERDPGFRVRIEERGHRFFVEHGARMRENRLIRIVLDKDGREIGREFLAHNRCRVMY